jgi:bis(5'-nucleosyl)-tetraphosphatase (symmetrical)
MRPVFVGDVQGCADELDDLLGRVEARFGPGFALWQVGDLVNRGPSNVRVLERVRGLVEAGRARCVLGNHEIHLIKAALRLEKPRSHDTYTEVLEHPDARRWIDWLRRRPVAEIGALGAARFAMVHAAVHPDWTLDDVAEKARAIERLLGHDDEAVARAFLAGERDRELGDALGLLTLCRGMTRDGRWSPDYPGSRDDRGAARVAWHEVWAERGHAYGVVYGHWAMQGLHVAERLRGLDTGCVHHGRDHDGWLTAWLPEPDGAAAFATPDARFLQVLAHRRYYRESSGE